MIGSKKVMRYGLMALSVAGGAAAGALTGLALWVSPVLALDSPLLTQPGSAEQAPIVQEPVQQAAATAPQAVIERFHGVLLSAMQQAESLGVTGRAKMLDGPVRETFDFPRIAQLTAGRSWRSGSADEKQRLSDAFAQLSVATYASRMKGFSGQSFETAGVDDGPRGTRMVMTQLLSPGRDTIDLTYVLAKRKSGEWRVIDVLMQGTISELSVRKSEYGGVLSSGGLDGLSAALINKAEGLAGGL
ncbi:MAG: ABC transporter substrate-binding protein [Rhodospirillaceae bacterium]